MRKCRRVWRAMLIVLVGAGALSGCYYDPYTGYWYPAAGYYPYPWAYPFPPGYPYAYQPAPAPNPAQGYQGYAPGTAPPGNAPVQRAPLPPSQ
jgi:hypothetical protein